MWARTYGALGGGFRSGECRADGEFRVGGRALAGSALGALARLRRGTRRSDDQPRTSGLPADVPPRFSLGERTVPAFTLLSTSARTPSRYNRTVVIYHPDVCTHVIPPDRGYAPKQSGKYTDRSPGETDENTFYLFFFLFFFLYANNIISYIKMPEFRRNFAPSVLGDVYINLYRHTLDAKHA